MQQVQNLRELGIAVRGARRQAGMTQSELSQRAGVSRRWLIAIENGEAAAPDASKIFDTLRALNFAITLKRPEARLIPNQAAQEALDALGEWDD